ncbi:MAG: LapA family protein [Erythrobacter sp.]
MAVIRTIAWILLVCGLLTFSFYNWRPVEVTIWENLVLETKVPVVLVLAFLAGFVPLFAYHLSVKWALKRRIRSLENSLKMLATNRRSEGTGSSDGALAAMTAGTAESDRSAPADGGAGEGDGGGAEG